MTLRTKIVVEVANGNIQAIYTDQPVLLDLTVINWDAEEDHPGQYVKLPINNFENVSACIYRPRILFPSEMNADLRKIFDMAKEGTTDNQEDSFGLYIQHQDETPRAVNSVYPTLNEAVNRALLLASFPLAGTVYVANNRAKQFVGYFSNTARRLEDFVAMTVPCK